MPGLLSLEQNYPHPFNPSTVFEFYLPVKSHVSLAIFNPLGQKVAELIDKDFPPGSHEVVWEGTASNRDRVATGLYFYRLVAGNYVDSKKMILLK